MATVPPDFFRRNRNSLNRAGMVAGAVALVVLLGLLVLAATQAG